MTQSRAIAAMQHRIEDFAAAPGKRPGEPRDVAADLSQALAAIAAYHGVGIATRAGIVAAPDGPLEPRHLAEAAREHGLRLDERALPLSRLRAEDCPALAVDPAGHVHVVEVIEAEADRFARVRHRTSGVATLTRAGSADWAAFHVVPSADAAGEPGHDTFLDGVTRGAGPLYLQVVLATVAVNLLALALPLYTMNVYDRVLPNNAVDTLIALSAGTVLAILFDFALRMLRGALADKASQRIDVRLANRLHARMLGARLKSKAAASTGMQANTLREYETLREILSSTTLTVLGDIPFALLFLVVMGVIAGPLVIVPLVAIVLIVAANLAVNWPLARLQDKAFRDTAIKNTIVVETLNGLETLKAAGAEGWAAARYERAVAEHLRVGFWSRLWATLGLNLVTAGQAAATVATIVPGCLMVARGEMTGGALMACMMLIGRVLGPFSQIAAIAGRLHGARLAWRAVREMAQAPQERPDPAAFVALPEGPAALRIEDLSFVYDPALPPALHGVGLAIAPGERVGFIGGVGSGKSTLLKLILKLHEPSSGRITLGGLALSDIDPAQLRRRVGYCGQNPQLFQGSIRANLTLHRPQASDAEILAAATISGAVGWIGRLPRGLDTRLAENGAGLSGGQRQSIALTRALIGAPDMLLLDEPTSDMDGRMEAQVVANLRGALGTRGLLLVTHRPALLELVDRLVVFDEGRVVADGPKAQVMQALQTQALQRQARENAA